MIELILSTLAEFGLIREDYKHQKQISKKEKEDGIKRPIQKYFLQPSVLILIAVVVIGSLSAILFFTYQKTSVFPEKTKKEISEMKDRMENWNKNLGQYPTELNELIGNNPLRQDWKKDAWNREYKFMITKNGKGFLITSAGSDGKFGTKDDITSE
ncbi:general secretion pathway protein G [Winogradskyella eximia]|uniref:General secretion pathway protein G n=1 Tax=Winogradskyella eximia TaxID=262006 RepID=A0A3D9H1M4_9FLAO|nr:type II secretion system protein GspG [Winogradskyella eximia]RED43409.1 general secretion pathway protein G [Winogradskyella eximia]|tara:strand:+ start:35 stop:502 length:468 start_codon:yes stop_codon:yes gene_type:complete